MKTVKLFGVAGSGKTTFCLDVVKTLTGNLIGVPDKVLDLFDESDMNYELMDIGFTSFTRAAISSIKDKLRSSNIFLPGGNFFKTLNSVTWRLCGFDNQNKISEAERNEFFTKNHVSLKSVNDGEKSESDFIIEFYSGVVQYFAKYLKDISFGELKDYHNQFFGSENNLLDVNTLDVVLRRYDDWKNSLNKKDFVDSILDVYLKQIDIPVSVLIVDEAQDLTRLQAKVIDLWTKVFSKNIFVISGDDDQTVHEWAGANPEYLVEYQGDDMSVVKLEESFRLPKNIASFNNCILKRINYRAEKSIFSNNPDGQIYFLNLSSYCLLDFLKVFLDSSLKTFVLFRTNRLKNDFCRFLFDNSCITFSDIRGSANSWWSHKLINVCNALNKLELEQDLLKREVEALFSVLPSKTCLVRGVKSAVKKSDAEVFSAVDVLKMTNLWSENVFVGLKEKIVRYINYVSGSNVNDFKRNDSYRSKLLSTNKIIKLSCVDDDEEKGLSGDVKNYVGTFHSVKGLESDNTIVFLETSQFFGNINDSEKRCFYVACSRSKRNLVFVGAEKNFCLEREFGDLILEYATRVGGVS